MYKEPVNSNLHYLVLIFLCDVPFLLGLFFMLVTSINNSTVSMQMQHNMCECVCAEGEARHMLWFLQTVGKNHSVFLPLLPPLLSPLSLCSSSLGHQ